MRLILAFAILLASSAVADDKPIEIPLKNVWAYDMPGTRDIRELDDGKAEKELIEPLLKHIQENWRADRGMAVRGESLEALREFYRIKVKGEDAQSVFKAGDPMSLVFYTKHTGVYVHLQSVRRDGNDYTVAYKLVRHTERIGSQHLALIPIGSPLPGKYRVHMKPLPSEGAPTGLLPLQIERVSKAFSFVVNN